MIEANNVIKKYGQVTALDDFTVDIPKGKIGIFDIEKNKINHRLNSYKVSEGSFEEIF